MFPASSSTSKTPGTTTGTNLSKSVSPAIPLEVRVDAVEAQISPP